MKQNGHRNNTAFILILLGMAFLFGTLFSSGRGLSFGRDRVVVREVVEDIRSEQEIMEERELMRPVPPVRPIPLIKPMPPYPFIEETGLSVGYLILSLLNNLLAVGFILVGIWLLVRHRRGMAVPPEKSPTSLDQ